MPVVSGARATRHLSCWRSERLPSSETRGRRRARAEACRPKRRECHSFRTCGASGDVVCRRHTKMESVPPVRVPIFFETTVETVATRAAQPPDTALHLFPDCTLRDTCELLWGADESSAAGVARKAPALVLSLIYPGEWPPPSPRAVPIRLPATVVVQIGAASPCSRSSVALSGYAEVQTTIQQSGARASSLVIRSPWQCLRRKISPRRCEPRRREFKWQ